MNGTDVGTGKHGRCRDVAIVGRFSIRGFERMDQKSGQENMADEERWTLVEVRLYRVEMAGKSIYELLNFQIFLASMP